MDQTTRSTSGIPLPPELVLSVIKRLRKPDLKHVRLVCRSLRLLVIPLLFDQIAFSPCLRALNVANRTAPHFGQHFKTVFYFPVKYRHLTQDDFEEVSHEICDDSLFEDCIRQDDEDGHTDNQSLQQHTEHSFRSYSRRAQEELDLHRNGAHLAHLCLVLSNIPRARKMVIGATESGEHIRVNDMRHLGIDLREMCPRKDCILSLEIHLNKQPVPHCHSSADILDFFHPSMLALHATGSGITKIDFHVQKPRDEPSALLAISAFGTLMVQSRYLVFRLATMTKLRFDLEINTRGTADKEFFNRRDVAKALATARNLECLYISLSMDFENQLLTTFDAILGGCHLTKLKSLVLECFDVEQAELLDCLKHPVGLKALYLHDIHPIAGSRERAAGKLRRFLRVKEVELSCPRHYDWAAFVYHSSKACVCEVEDLSSYERAKIVLRRRRSRTKENCRIGRNFSCKQCARPLVF